MKKEEYYKKSKSEGLPKRCPILNYCSRRAFTIYYFSGYSSFNSSNSIVDILIKEGEIPHDFEKKKIQLQGESPIHLQSNGSRFYQNMCPEVNLFDSEHSLSYAKGIASTDGSYDRERKKGEEFVSSGCKHFSECPEFSKYLFDNNNYRPKKSTPRKRRTPISKKMRFEIFQRDNFTCHYCKRNKDIDGVKLEVDHIIPIAEGGKDDFENLVTSCYDCNQGKSNKII